MSLIKYLITIAVLIFSLGLSALPSDSYEPIYIESDSAERNEKTGLTQYVGNVNISQGSMLIDADQVTIYYEGSAVSRILCKGNLASYQQADQSGDRVIARAETIEYIPSKKLINLKTNASLSNSDSGTQIKGDTINYDLNNETWKAKGDNQSTQKRIQLVIPAPQKNSTTESSDLQ
ncbi:MAG: lipopolysaccharide transport periplasmic protein LptA [Porticoccaceae bacterium]